EQSFKDFWEGIDEFFGGSQTKAEKSKKGKDVIVSKNFLHRQMSKFPLWKLFKGVKRQSHLIESMCAQLAMVANVDQVQVHHNVLHVEEMEKYFINKDLCL